MSISWCDDESIGGSAVKRSLTLPPQVGEAWAALLRDWLPSSGLQLDARPCFEYYPKDAACDSQTGTFECEICIPVAPLGPRMRTCRGQAV
jgi:AraC family transcriptional regulator